MARPSRWTDVVAASAKVFRRRGFAQASLEEIADELGIVRCHVDVLVDVYDFAAVYLYEVAGRDIGPEFRAADREYAGLVERVVAEGVADGTFPAGRDPRLTTMTLLGALNWLTRWWDPRGATGPDVVADQVSDIVLGVGLPSAG